ncbi:MAG: hypothetical protein U0835_02320 [Isosphaeraceae bacterium]
MWIPFSDAPTTPTAGFTSPKSLFTPCTPAASEIVRICRATEVSPLSGVPWIWPTWT